MKNKYILLKREIYKINNNQDIKNGGGHLSGLHGQKSGTKRTFEWIGWTKEWNKEDI